MSNEVDHPKHYNAHPSGVEAIEICEFLSFNLGNAVKYLWRAGKKIGQGDLLESVAVRDLKKSLWYLNRALEAKHLHASNYFPIDKLYKVIRSDPSGSVLRDVLEFTVARMVGGSPPRIADAIIRVECEIARIHLR